MEPAATRCKSCGRALCGLCWQHTVDHEPWCEMCIGDLRSGARQRWPLAITFFGICAALVALGWRWELRRGGAPTHWIWISLTGLALIIAAVIALRQDERAPERVIAARTPDQPPAFDARARVGHPYRTRLRRLARAVAPPLSGRATVLVVALALALPAIALPFSLGLPRWIEAELVLAAWWLIWVATLSTLLFKGFRLSHDFVLAPRRWRFDPSPSGDGSAAAAGCGDVSACLGEAISGVLILLLLTALAFVVAWLLVELVAPLVFLLTYTLIRGAIARVANDEHGCEGNLGSALGWGTLWATVYVAPLALAVWGLHLLFRAG
jgi:hypothetical protein